MKKKGIRAAIVAGSVFVVIASILLYGFLFANRKDAAAIKQAPYMFQPLAAISGETVTTAQITEDIRQTVYRSNGGDDPYCTYLTINGCNYYLGASLDEGLLLEKTPLAPVEGNNPVFMWSEIRGAAYGCSRFMTLRDGKPVYLFDIDGYPTFVDLDGDGQSEIVAVHPGTLSETCIYFWGQYNEGIRKMNVNTILKASSVYYKDGKFVVNKEANVEKFYIYQNRMFKQIQD